MVKWAAASPVESPAAHFHVDGHDYVDFCLGTGAWPATPPPRPSPQSSASSAAGSR